MGRLHELGGSHDRGPGRPCAYACYWICKSFHGAITTDFRADTSQIGCIVMLSLFTAMVARFAGTENTIGQGFAVFFLFAFVGFYGGCVDAVSWIYCAEVFPTHARARGFSISVATFLSAALVYTQCAPLAFDNIGWKFYLVFILVTTIGTVGEIRRNMSLKLIYR